MNESVHTHKDLVAGADYRAFLAEEINKYNSHSLRSKFRAVPLLLHNRVAKLGLLRRAE